MTDRKLLAVDTSGPVCGVAVLEGERVLCEYTVQNRNTHSVNLMPMIEEALRSAGRELAEMDALAVVAGPGSFTGVRIGVATVKGLAHGSGKKCIAVNALEALSRGVGCFDGAVCPIQDARAGQVYGAAFVRDERILPDRPVKLEEFLDDVRSAAPGMRLLFTGDGVPVHRARIREMLGEEAVFAPPALCWLRPSVAGLLALEKGQETDWSGLREIYLRPPHAEKNQKLLEAMRNE